MWKVEIKPGAEYALRERRIRGTPFQRVRIIEHIRGNNWKAEWVDPNPGLGTTSNRDTSSCRGRSTGHS